MPDHDPPRVTAVRPGEGHDPVAPHLWHLDPAVAHLNHGSYGAVPIPVLAAQARVARAIERSPERFYRADLAPALDAVRHEVAAFLGADPEATALVENATAAVQVALEAVAPGPGQEVVLTDHAYPWVRAAVERACAGSGARVRCVTLPLDAHGAVDDDALVDALAAAVGARTALVALDQITSASALRLPVERVIAALPPAAPLLVDGAHAPGLVERPVPTGAAFWLGNLHKWAFSARTAAALVVAPAWRGRVRPLVASAAAAEGFPRAFDYLGTQDASAFLALPEALAFPRAHLGMGFGELRERNRAVLAAGLEGIAARTGLRPGPEVGLPMRTLDLGRPGDPGHAAAWTTRLRELGVEVAVVSLGGRLHARVSVQAYVGVADLERLGDVLAKVLGAGA
jgi:isopenicillin-N epimerase